MESSVPNRPSPPSSSPAAESSSAAAAVEYRAGDEVVPGYTLISPLGSGMAGDVWVAQAAGGVRVALKVIRSLAMVGGRKELRALKTIRNVKHPNLCPVFGFWTKDEQGRILADGETELLATDTVDFAQPSPGPSNRSGPDAIGETMSIGVGSTPVDVPADGGDLAHAGSMPDSQSRDTLRQSAQQLIVVMGLGDRTLFDRLREVRLEAGIPADDSTKPLGLSPAETIRYLRAAAGAIDLLNRDHQIYHCDIKPQNILIVGGDAQVCDFGLANKIEDDMRKTQQAFATPAYAAPEVLQGQTYSRTVDQYSLAVTYFELRTGLLPFDITTQANMVVAKCTGKLDLSKVTPAERKVLSRAMEVDPARRYPSCSDFVTAIARATGVEQAGGLSLRKLLLGTAAALLVLTFALGGWRAIDPDGFAAAIAQLRGGPTPEQELAVAEELLEASTNAAYLSPENRLRQAAELAMGALAASDEQTQRRAAQLTADAIAQLNTKIRRTLLDEPALNDNQLATIENGLRWLDQELSPAERPIPERPRLLATTWLNQIFLDQRYRSSFASDTSDRLASLLKSDPTALSSTPQRIEASLALLLTRAAQAGVAMESLLHSESNNNHESRDVAPLAESNRALRQSLVECEQLVMTHGMAEVPAFYRDRWQPLRDRSLESLRQFVAEAEPNSPDRAAVMAAFPGLAAEAELSAAHRALVRGDLDQIREHLQALAELDPSAFNSALQPQIRWLRDAVALLGPTSSRLQGLRRMIEPDRLETLRAIPRPSLEKWVEMIVDTIAAESPSMDDVFVLHQSITTLAKVTGIPTRLVDQTLLTAAINHDAVSAERLQPLLQSPSLDPALRPLSAAIRLETLARSGQRPPQTEVRGLRQSISDDGLAANAVDLPEAYASLVIAAADLLLDDEAEAVQRLEEVRQQAVAQPNADLATIWSAGRRRWVAEQYLQFARRQSGVQDQDLRHRYTDQNASLAVWIDRAGQWLGTAASAHPSWRQEKALVQLAKPLAEQDAEVIAPFDSADPSKLNSPMLHGLLRLQLARCKPGVVGGAAQREQAIVRLIALAGETVQRLPAPQRLSVEAAENFFAPVMAQMSVLIGRAGNNQRQLDTRIDPVAALEFCTAMLESARAFEVQQAFRDTGDPGPWYADLETAAAVAASLEQDPRRAAARWLEAAEYYRQEKDLEGDGWTSAQDVVPLERYIESARAVAGDTPRILLAMALAAERRSKVVVRNSDRVAALDRAAALCEQVVSRSEDGSSGPETEWLVEKFDALWNHTNILVQRAFYHAAERTQLLERGREKATAAIAMTDRYPDHALEWSTAAAYSSLGNACEDLGLYCYTTAADHELQMQRFEQAGNAFREAVKLTRGSGGFKDSLYLARCLIRHHDNGGPASLLDEAEAHLLEPSADVSIDLRARWGMWRSVLAQRRGEPAEALKFAEDVFELLRHQTAPHLHDEKSDAAIFFAELLYRTDPANARQVLDVIAAVKEPSPKHRWKSLAIRMIAHAELQQTAEAIKCYDEMLQFAPRDMVDEPELVIPPLGDGALDLYGFLLAGSQQLTSEQLVQRLDQAAHAASQAAPLSANSEQCRWLAGYVRGLRGLVDGTPTRPAIATFISALENLPEGPTYQRMGTEGRMNLWIFFGRVTRTEDLGKVLTELAEDANRLAEQFEQLAASDAVNPITRQRLGNAIVLLRGSGQPR